MPVPEVLVNRWSNGLAPGDPLPNIDHRKTLCTVAQSPREASLHRRRRTALVLTAVIAAAAPALTACGNEAHPGAAAVVGGQRITVAQLQSRVNEVRTAQRSAVQNQAQYERAIATTGGLTRETLYGMVFDQVVHRAAQDAGVTVTRKDIQDMRAYRPAGGRRQGPGGDLAGPVRRPPEAPRREPPPPGGGPQTRRETRHRHHPARLLEGPLQRLQGTPRRPQPALRHVGCDQEQQGGREDALGAGGHGGGDSAVGVSGGLAYVTGVAGVTVRRARQAGARKV